MIKATIVILFIINVFACGPVQQTSSKNKTSIDPHFLCLASQSNCDVKTKDGIFNIQFSGKIEQGKIKTELPFHIQIGFKGIDDAYQIKSISSYLEGKTMFMGKIPVTFKVNKTNVRVAESLLASCSEEVMTWRLWFKVEIIADGEVHQQDFFIDFDSERL